MDSASIFIFYGLLLLLKLIYLLKEVIQKKPVTLSTAFSLIRLVGSSSTIPAVIPFLTYDHIPQNLMRILHGFERQAAETVLFSQKPPFP